MKHIFYGSIAALLALGACEAKAGDHTKRKVNDVYEAPPEESYSFSYLTVSKYAPENGWASYLGYLDWVNPVDWCAAVEEAGVAVDRWFKTKLVGTTVTTKQDGIPKYTYAFDTQGNLVSVGVWHGEEMTTMTGEEYPQTRLILVKFRTRPSVPWVKPHKRVKKKYCQGYPTPELMPPYERFFIGRFLARPRPLLLLSYPIISNGGTRLPPRIGRTFLTIYEAIPRSRCLLHSPNSKECGAINQELHLEP